MWHVIDHDDNTTTYTWSGNKLVGILDPAGHLTQFGNNGTLITSITDFAGRETDLSYSGTQLTTVTLPDPDYNNEEQPVFNFGYDPTIGLMTSYQDANGDTSTFSYRVDGTLQTVTAADGSTVGYQSALSPPLLPGEGGGEGAVGTDSNPAALVLSRHSGGHPDRPVGQPHGLHLRSVGDPTSVENCAGQYDDLPAGRQRTCDGDDPAQPKHLFTCADDPSTRQLRPARHASTGEGQPRREHRTVGLRHLQARPAA